MNNRMKIILGSASPRRKELLSQIGLEFEVVVSNVEEEITSVVPCDVVEELSLQKAKGVLKLLQHQGMEKMPYLIIGADTIVACGNKILGKPKDALDAKDMLRLLQGRAHEVYTGVTVLYVCGMGCEQERGQEKIVVQPKTFHEVTKVIFTPMSEEEIEDYVATKEPMDKAGAYGIQGMCARYISGIQGDYNNVVGLPVGRLYQEIKNTVLTS